MNREQTLQEALKCVTKDRQSTYGTPESNFGCIADLWSAYLGRPITAQQVAVMMILLKISRTKSSPGYEDNYVDIAGYAACAAELVDPPVNMAAVEALLKPGDTVIVPADTSMLDLQQTLLRKHDTTVNCKAIGDVSKGAKVEC